MVEGLETDIEFDVVISVCAMKTMKTWIKASQNIPNYIKSKRYIVVVPQKDLEFFEAITPSIIEVLSENSLASEFDKEYIMEHVQKSYRTRSVAWYYQQFLKIKALQKFTNSDEDLLLVWDADTVPLKAIPYINDGKLAYCKATENHAPYFETINYLLGYGKVVRESFVSQNFPIYGKWVNEFIDYIEKKHNANWYDAILKVSEEQSHSLEFSEYETLGSFIAKNYPNDFTFQECEWERYGKRKGNINQLEKIKNENPNLQYISYENWEATILKKNYKTAIVNTKSENDFTKEFFNLPVVKTVIQVGANDGVMEDPLNYYLTSNKYNDVYAILVEPLPYYFKKLASLHENRPNTTLLNNAICQDEVSRDFYFIKPEIAAEMNGNGPQNNWAHGQGSFFKDSVEYWINKNSFRGEEYIANIDVYLNSIVSTSLGCISLKQLSYDANNLILLLIDAQGSEKEIILGLDWNRAPDVLIFEQDRVIDTSLHEFLNSLSYKYIAGQDNALFINTDTVDIQK
jgi:hypothetical protein